MSALTATGPNFFDLQDNDGNTLMYSGGNMNVMEKEDWCIGQFTNFYTVPSKSSDLILSSFMTKSTSNGSNYRLYWSINKKDGEVGWTSNSPDYNIPVPPVQINPAQGCGYYVQQGSLYLQKPDPVSKQMTFASTPVVWNAKPTTGQAFLLQNPSDSTYVTWDGTTIGSTSTIAKAAAFEYVNGFIVVYGTYNNSAGTVSIINIGADLKSFTITKITGELENLVTGMSNGYNVTSPGTLMYGNYYLGMPSGTTSTFTTLTSSAGSLITVQPPASMIDPSTLYIYAYGAYTNINFANPTPYSFNPNVCRSSSNGKKKKKLSTAAIAGIAGGAALVVILTVAGVVYWYKNRQT